jgi:L-ascorbate metabolism protein UlaG (beta-lactamase superfamily)
MMSGRVRRRNAAYRRLVARAEHEVVQKRERGELCVTFFGVSTILFDDGETQIITDGFFSRPSAFKVLFARLHPNQRRIAYALDEGQVKNLAAIFVSHSHFDHAMDAPTLAAVTGATIYGSRSTEQLTIGAGVGGERFQKITPTPVRIGRFTVRALPSAHSPGDTAPGPIFRPVRPGARRRDWRTGDCYSFLITHDERNILVHASAGFAYGALRGVNVETLYLGVGLLGKQPYDYMETYWREVAETTKPAVIVPVHWDNLTRKLNRPFRFPPVWFDDVPRALEFLEWKCIDSGIEFRLPARLITESPWPNNSN